MGPEKLVEDLRKDLADHRVLVVVGTGVSLQASGDDPRAGWSGLILDGIARCEGVGHLTAGEAAALRDRLEKNKDDGGTLREIGEEVQTRLGRELRGWLQDSIGQLRPVDREILDVIHSLGAPLATTNYDNLLSTGRGIDPVPWNDGAKVQELIRHDRRGVLHFHGFYDDPASVILGVKSYEAILEAKGAQAVQQVVAASKTLLFVGCGSAGLADPNFGALLQWFESVFPHTKYRHYCLCRSGELADLRSKHPALSFIDYGADYSDLVPALRDLAPPARPGTGLPVAGHCFGRNEEIDELVSELSKKRPRPLPILGGPGMGKTTIAVAALHKPRIAARFGARRWFVRCDGVKTRAELAAAIARAIGGIEITSNVESRVLDELANGRAALVLDNSETPLIAEPQPVEELLSLLAGIDSLALVVTIRGKKRPEAVPWGPTIEVKPLSDKAARETFVAAAGKKTFAKDPDLPRLLSALEGAPLPITLMARFAESFNTLDPVRKRWETKKTAILSTGSDRLTNITISYELSYEALTSDARRLLSVLAMLPDGVAHADLPEIFDDPERIVDELRGRALIEHEEKRVRMLAPLREVIAVAHPPGADNEARAVRHYLRLAAEEGYRVGRIGGEEAVVRLTPELANMEAMLARSSLENSEAVMDAVYGWGELMRLTGVGSPSVIEGIRARAGAASHTELAARCCKTLGDIALYRSDQDSARERYEEALPLYRKVGSLLGEANCIQSLGDIALQRSDHDSARERYEEALPLYGKVGDLLGEANCILRLGDIALERSDDDSARERFEEALPLYRRVGSLLGEANCVQSLADIALQRSDYDSARERYEEALPLYGKVGDLLGEANCILRLGDVALRRSDHDSARERFEEALPLYRKVGSLLGEANCIRGLGDIARNEKDPLEATTRYREAIVLYERIPEPYSIGGTHRRLARVASDDGARRGHVDAARAAWRSIGRDDLVAELDVEFGGAG